MVAGPVDELEIALPLAARAALNGRLRAIAHTEPRRLRSGLSPRCASRGRRNRRLPGYSCPKMDGPQRQPVFVPPGAGRSLSGLICRVTSASTGGEYCTFELLAQPGEGVPLHVHAREDEIYYILDGELEIECGGKLFSARAGAMAVLPRRIPHAFRNAAKFPARALTVFVPGGFDEFVEELDRMPAADAADEQKRNLVREKYGIRML